MFPIYFQYDVNTEYSHICFDLQGNIIMESDQSSTA